MPDPLEKNSPDLAKPDVPGLNFLDLVKPDAIPAPREVNPKAPPSSNPLTLEMAKTLSANSTKWTIDEVAKFSEGMNPFDKKVVFRIFNTKANITSEDSLNQVKEAVVQGQQLVEWFQQKPELSSKFELSPSLLTAQFGNRPLQEFKNFVNIMDKFGYPDLKLTSPGQINIQEAFRVAQAQSLAQLPDYVVGDLIKFKICSQHDLQKLTAKEANERIPNAIKGWRIEPTLRLADAERIGKLSPLERIAVDLKLSSNYNSKSELNWSDETWRELKDSATTNPEKLIERFSEISFDMSHEGMRAARFQLLAEAMLPGQTAMTQRSVGDCLNTLTQVRWPAAEESINPYELLKRINPEILKVCQSANSDANEIKEKTIDDIKLSLLFQDKNQLGNFLKNRTSEDVVALLNEFKLEKVKGAEGLGEWLASPNPNRNKLADINVVKNWPYLTEQQKKLGAPELSAFMSDALKRAGTGNSAEGLGFGGGHKPEYFKTLFRALELYPEVSTQGLKILLHASSCQTNFSETLNKEMLPDAIKGWSLEWKLPIEMAAKVGNMKYAWERAAGALAWREIANQPNESREQKIQRFPEVFERTKSTGKINVLLQFGNPFIAVDSLFPTIPQEYRTQLARLCLRDQGQIVGVDGIGPAPENPVKKLIGLQAGVFRDALALLQGDGENVRPLWHAPAAFGLASTFGKDWKQWLDRMEKRGVNKHDATYFLPQRSTKENEGLKEFLFKNVERDITDLETIAKRWTELTPEKRKLPFKELLLYVQSVRYINARDSEFAAENARWSVSPKDYAQREKRFLISRDTPSPFPMEKVWESGNLQGYFLPRNDPRGLHLGQHTGCCQHPDGVGASSAWHGQESPDGGFFVVTDKSKPGTIIAQSWAWVSDSGGMCFDSIESINLAGREKQVAEIYKNAATDLASTKFHTVTVSNSSAFHSLSRYMPNTSQPGSDALQRPGNYNGYTDAFQDKQITLAKNDKLEKRSDVEKQVWVKAAENGDQHKMRSIAERVYPEGWRTVPDGDLNIVMENRKNGTIGYAVLDTETKTVNDLAVLTDHRNQSPLILRTVLKQISDIGGEWTCSARSSTSYALLKLAEKRGMIKILSETQDGTMADEKMYAIKFKVIPPASAPSPAPVRVGAETAPSGVQPAPEPTRPTPPEGRNNQELQLSEPATAELRKQLASATALIAKPNSESQKLTPNDFREALELALTKMKNNPDIPTGDLVLIDGLQNALNSSTQEDVKRITELQTQLEILATLEPKFKSPEVDSASSNQTKSETATTSTKKPSSLQLPELTIVTSKTELKAGTEKSSIISENEKARDKTAAKKPGMKTATKVAVSGIGTIVGVATVVQGGLELYETLKNRDKDKNKKEKK